MLASFSAQDAGRALELMASCVSGGYGPAVEAENARAARMCCSPLFFHVHPTPSPLCHSWLAAPVAMQLLRVVYAGSSSTAEVAANSKRSTLPHTSPGSRSAEGRALGRTLIGRLGDRLAQVFGRGLGVHAAA